MKKQDRISHQAEASSLLDPISVKLRLGRDKDGPYRSEWRKGPASVDEFKT